MTYTHKATCRFTVASWKESVYVDIDGEGTTSGEMYYPKRGLTHAEVGYAYTGGLEGTSTLAYLIAYKADAAPVLGLEQFSGSVDGHEGTCVFQHIGNQDAGSVSAHLEVVPGMGTGGLENLRGEAELLIAGHGNDGFELALSYDI
jgi:Protein of unknown function (DUF3224)